MIKQIEGVRDYSIVDANSIDGQPVGMRSAAEPVKVTVGTTDTIVLGSSEARRAIFFSPPVGARVAYYWAGKATIDSYFQMQPGDPVLIVTEQMVG